MWEQAHAYAHARAHKCSEFIGGFSSPPAVTLKFKDIFYSCLVECHFTCMKWKVNGQNAVKKSVMLFVPKCGKIRLHTFRLGISSLPASYLQICSSILCSRCSNETPSDNAMDRGVEAAESSHHVH